MYCMKCGREIPEQDVFCQDCLAVMEQYPVKPGTVVQLPRRREHSPARKNHILRKAPASPEEQVKGLRKVILWLTVAVLVMSLAIGLMIYPTVSHFFQSKNFLPGQNYSTVTEPEAGSLTP